MGLASNGQRIDGTGVPGPTEFHHALNAYNQALMTAKHAWNRLSDAEKQALSHPPFLQKKH
jgi:hypothetical protein